MTTDEGPAIAPVKYDMSDGAVASRTAPASVPSLAAGREVALEVDRICHGAHQSWATTATGHAA